MPTLESLQGYIGAWDDNTFPSHYHPDSTPNPRSPLYHLIDPQKGEVHEFLRAFMAGQDTSEELADCAILPLTTADLADIVRQNAELRRGIESVAQQVHQAYHHGPECPGGDAITWRECRKNTCDAARQLTESCASTVNCLLAEIERLNGRRCETCRYTRPSEYNHRQLICIKFDGIWPERAHYCAAHKPKETDDAD
jgi:hypothetical protein